jgi:hypothetical protein
VVIQYRQRPAGRGVPWGGDELEAQPVEQHPKAGRLYLILPGSSLLSARLLRPVVAAAVIIPLFVDRPPANGSSLAVELAGVAAGLLGGLAAAALMGVYRSSATGKPVSRAGWPYAIFWTAVTTARAAFSYGAAHWFTAQIVSWAITNHVTEASIVDGLIFMAIAMILVRTAVLAVRASRLAAPTFAELTLR